MKTLLIILFTGLAGVAVGQNQTPAPTTAYRGADGSLQQQQSPFRHPTPPPTGFWVVEKAVGQPSVVHYYTDQQYELRTDTLTAKRLNLKSRTTVAWLNARLATVISGQTPVISRK